MLEILALLVDLTALGEWSCISRTSPKYVSLQKKTTKTKAKPHDGCLFAILEKEETERQP